MKTIYKYTIIISLFFTITLNAQTPIIDLDGWNGNEITNAYYKDINNFLSPFEGTWLYTDGNTSFKIVLTKQNMLYTGKFYVDYITGEYQYIENGVEISNTLDNTDIYSHGIYGNNLLKSHNNPPCSDCPLNERRIDITIYDRIHDTIASITLKLVTINGLPALEGYIRTTVNNVQVIGEPPIVTEMNFPIGFFNFIKQ